MIASTKSNAGIRPAGAGSGDAFGQSQKIAHEGWWARYTATRRDGRGVAWGGFGKALEDAGRTRAAINAYRRALRRDPVDFPSRHRAGTLLRWHGHTQAAKMIYRELLAINPHDPVAMGQLGNILVDGGHTRDYHEAEGLLRRALDILNKTNANIDIDAVIVPLCRLLAAQQRDREILALTQDCDTIFALLERGQTEAALGDFVGARASFQRVLVHDPAHPRAWYHIAGLKLMDGAATAAGLPKHTDMVAWLVRQAENHEGETRMWFAFAAAYALEAHASEDRCHLGKAWSWYREANARVRDRLASNVASIENYERRTIQTYSAPVLNRLSQGQVTTPGPTPVFVVGMPRSGTTLMERIIGAHPEAAPLGERADLHEVITAASHVDGSEHLPWPERAGQVHPYTVGAIGGAYFARIHSLAHRGTKVAIDKLPEQFQLLGLIAAVMPQARIIHMTRDPGDVGISCYTARFHDGLAWTFDLESIARRQASYDRLMDHWRGLIPAARLLEVPYESLVRAPEGWTARVLAFLGLNWDARCLNGPETTDAPVRTTSMGQVRARISTDAVGRCQRLRQAGAAELDVLATAPSAVANTESRRL